MAAMVGAAAMLAGARWLRVAQREHYLPGSVIRFAWRWWRRDPTLWVGVAAMVAGRWLPAIFLLVPIVVAAGPRGLRVRGVTAPLHWTPRLRRLAVVMALPVLALVATGDSILMALAVAFVPGWVDLALAGLAPVEHRLGRRWVEQAASALRRSGARVVAITGSYGKTTTKLYVAHLLAGRNAVVASPASFNNRMGLARAINQHLVPGTEIFVAEMGTYGRGEIAKLCAWIPPEVAAITAIGPVHLERMRSEETIVAAKREILENARVAVLNVDHRRLAAVAAEEEKLRSVIRCSATDQTAEVFASAETGEVKVRGALIGSFDHTRARPGNVACAVGLVVGLGIDPDGNRLGSLPVAGHRLTVSVSDRGFEIIDDTFNANPAGAREALAMLARTGRQRRVVVTPGMVELGSEQNTENHRFAAEVARLATEVVIVGRTNRSALAAGAREGGAVVIVVPTRTDAVAWVRDNLGPGSVVLYENDLPDHYP